MQTHPAHHSIALSLGSLVVIAHGDTPAHMLQQLRERMQETWTALGDYYCVEEVRDRGQCVLRVALLSGWRVADHVLSQ